MVNSDRNERFQALDGLRGVAALGVLLFHTGEESTPWLFPHAYLAVDFFFALSGFVIASAYEKRLRSGMRVRDFLMRRWIRLYPLILLSVILGAIGFSLDYSGYKLLILAVTAALLIPTPWASVRAGGELIPLNPVSWSLLFELLANFAYALIAPVLKTRLLICIIFVGSVSLIACGFVSGSIGFGDKWSNGFEGIPRVTLPFFYGVGLFRLYDRRMLLRFRCPLWLLVLALLVCFMVPSGRGLFFLYDFAVVVILFPILIACGANASVGGLATACSLSGALSYPIYILQSGIIVHIRGLPGHLHAKGLIAFLVVTLSSTLFIFFSYAILKFYDEPVRAWLTARWTRPRQFAATTEDATAQ